VRHWPILARCAYQSNVAPAVAAQNSFVSLYNDSSAAQVIAMRDYAVNPTVGAGIEGFLVSQAKLGATPLQGISVYTPGGAMPGQLLIGSVAALPTFNLFPTGGTTAPGWLHDFPMVVLAPGWSLTAYGNTLNLVLSVYFWWEWMYPAQLLNPDIGPEHISH